MAVVGILAVIAFVNRGIPDPTVESAVSRYGEKLRAIATDVPAPADPAPNWIERAGDRLATVKANVEMADAIARNLEHLLATRSSGCTLANAAGDTIGKELGPATIVTQNALGALLLGAHERLKILDADNTALGWLGWRGSREEEISGLALLVHEIEMASANADLAFTRLKNEAAALSRMRVTCE
jgi:hypothetical protein